MSTIDVVDRAESFLGFFYFEICIGVDVFEPPCKKWSWTFSALKNSTSLPLAVIWSKCQLTWLVLPATLINTPPTNRTIKYLYSYETRTNGRSSFALGRKMGSAKSESEWPFSDPYPFWWLTALLLCSCIVTSLLVPLLAMMSAVRAGWDQLFPWRLACYLW